MIKMLHKTGTGLTLLLFSCLTINAQVKGDPLITILPDTAALEAKSSSRLSAPLTQLYESYAPADIERNGRSKPALPSEGMSKNIQVIGDQVIIDITALASC